MLERELRVLEIDLRLHLVALAPTSSSWNCSRSCVVAMPTRKRTSSSWSDCAHSRSPRGRQRALLVGLQVGERGLDLNHRGRERRPVLHASCSYCTRACASAARGDGVVERHLEGQHRGVVVEAEAPQSVERVAVDAAEGELGFRSPIGGSGCQPRRCRSYLP